MTGDPDMNALEDSSERLNLSLALRVAERQVRIKRVFSQLQSVADLLDDLADIMDEGKGPPSPTLLRANARRCRRAIAIGKGEFKA